MTEQNSTGNDIGKMVNKASPKGLAKLIKLGLGASAKSVPKVTKQEVYDFLERQGIDIPHSIADYVDTILSKIENPYTTSQASFCEARRQVGTYLEVMDDTRPVPGAKTRAEKFYELMDAWEKQRK